MLESPACTDTTSPPSLLGSSIRISSLPWLRRGSSGLHTTGLATIRSTSLRAYPKVSQLLQPPFASVTFGLGIKVSNTPGAVDDATATTALYLIISTLRQYSNAERNLRKGAWNSGLDPGRAFDVTGKTLAILGMGGIGTRIAELARAFPMRVIYHNRRPAEGAPPWAEYYPKERLAAFLKEADVLAVSIPLRQETEGFVGEEMIRGLKRGAIMVNTARGKVIDEDAMIRALEDGHVCPPVILFAYLLTHPNLVRSWEPWVWMCIRTSRR